MGLANISESAQVLRAKSALYAWLHIGSDGYPKRQQQRILLTNVMVTATAILSYGHAIFFALYDLEQLKWPIMLVLVIPPLILATPFLNKTNPYLGSVYNLVLWLGYACTLAIIFGFESGVHFYFLAGAASAILIMGVYQNPLSVISIILQIGFFIFFDRAMKPPAEFLELAPGFYNALDVAAILLSMFFIYCMVFYAFYQAHLAEDALEREYEYSETLLANMMPATIAAQLKQNPGQTIADSHEDVTILFADIVGFTPRAEGQNATELVQFLNDLFTRFDQLTHKYQLEKIKTLGDAFMVAGGLPDPQPDHAERVARMALDMLTETQAYAKQYGETVDLRIGIHSGPVVAGVIGTQKPFYDVWGDTVNTAARLETYGTKGEIQVTAATRALLNKTFKFKHRGKVEIKGKGELDLWYLSKLRD
jgi:adenylate cyclase